MVFDFATQACLSSDSWVQVLTKRLKGLEVPLTLHGYIIQSIVQCPVRLFRSVLAVHNLFRIFFTQLKFTNYTRSNTLQVVSTRVGTGSFVYSLSLTRQTQWTLRLWVPLEEAEYLISSSFAGKLHAFPVLPGYLSTATILSMKIFRIG